MPARGLQARNIRAERIRTSLHSHGWPTLRRAGLGCRGSGQHGGNGGAEVVKVGELVKVNPGAMQDARIVVGQGGHIDAEGVGIGGGRRHGRTPYSLEKQKARLG